MNELDKVSPENGDLNRDEVVAVAATETTDGATPEALAIEETEVTAEADGDEESAAKNYHSMTREEMIESLKEILSSGNMEAHKEVAAIKQAYYSLVNREATARLEAYIEAGNTPETFSSEPDPLEPVIKELLGEFREKRAAYLEEKEEEKRRNLEEKNNIIDQLNGIVEDIDNINLHFPKFQELQAAFKAIGEVPATAETDLWKSYNATVEQFYDRLKMNKELRDLDFKKNLELKQALVEKARQLNDVTDVVEAFKRLQDLHDQWREIGPVAKELRDEIWNEFKEASTLINKRHQDFFQNRKNEEAENETTKIVLCEKVENIDYEPLKTFADWDAKTKEVIELQKRYKEIGFAPRKSNSLLFARFRKACDAFFTAKAEYFKKTKDEFKENLAKKEALCAKAEALLPRAEEKKAFEELQALQAEWRTVGVVRRRQGDEVWKRFCDAIDAFQAVRRKYLGAQRSTENENLKAKQAIIEKLKEISEESERREVIGTIRDLQDEWQKIGHVPFKQKEAVNTAYRAELKRLFSAFDMRENRSRMRRFEGEVKKMEGDRNSLGRERDRLLRAIESRENDIKTIQNNLGFFTVKSSAGNSMVKEFERKIEKIREEIKEIREKIALLDAQQKQDK
ncbi:MAG: DUF349 domain-containing protein [Bacteroides sp.]|nr:DUF349 domain-containing protein [Bacteroides sp.]